MWPETMTTPTPGALRLPSVLHQELEDRQFVLNNGVYQRGALALVPCLRWLTLSELPNGPEPVPRFPVGLGGLGMPGLWKWIRPEGALHRVFEIPRWVLSHEPTEEDHDSDGPAPLGKMIDWALASRFRGVPPEWSAPPADLVTSWIPRGGLTVHARGFVRQIESIVQAERWALRVPLLAQAPEDLPAARKAALDEVVVEAQHRWALVRLGLFHDLNAPDSSRAAPASLLAEVDFTGAPHSEFLFSAGLDVLRHVVAWLVETVDVLGDPGVTLGSLAADGSNTTATIERRVP